VFGINPGSMSRLYLRCFHCLCRLNLRAVQNSKVVIVDGNQMFARPGPRLVDALEFLVGLLHNKPELSLGVGGLHIQMLTPPALPMHLHQQVAAIQRAMVTALLAAFKSKTTL